MRIKALMVSIVAIAIGTTNTFAQKDAFEGFYEGEVTAKTRMPEPFNSNNKIFLEIYRTVGEQYRMRIYPEMFTNSRPYWEANELKQTNGKISVPNTSYGFFDYVKLTATPEEVSGSCILGSLPAKLSFKRSKFESPTMGLKAPEGSTVLFDGKDTSKWFLGNGKPSNWEIIDGAMIVNRKTGKNTSVHVKNQYGALHMHLEFRTPAEYEIKGYQRGNSGVFFGPYEIQILESFGEFASDRYSGAIYTVSAPKVNASLEPLAWQTYDIDFTPAKYNDGKFVDFPHFTVYHNGVLVQDNSPCPTPTNKEMKKKFPDFHHPEKVGLVLQDHTHEVEFRNIWIQEK